jgi:hypothetical protein
MRSWQQRLAASTSRARARRMRHATTHPSTIISVGAAHSQALRQVMRGRNRMNSP